LAESPLVEGLIYAGTDDGLIHVTSDGGSNWSTVNKFSVVPDMSLIEDIISSYHDADTAYAVIDNHKRGDYKPYVLKTEDRGRSWDLISNNLPERGSAHTIIEDHVDPNLLFAGTEFGVFFSNNGGGSWNELTSLPTIAVRDLEIQRREGDLVVGTFGRGVYILDDYSPLRFSADELKSGPTLFSVRDAWLFNPDNRRGWGGKGDFGVGRYTADNPPYGAVFAYYLPEDLQSLKDKRRKTEQERAKEGGDNPYPSWDQLRREDREEAPSITLTVRDASGNVLQRIDAPAGKGFHRVAWNMRYPAPDPVNLKPKNDLPPWQSPPQGPMALPGQYSVSMSKRVEGQLVEISSKQSFVLKPLFEGGLVTDDRQALLDFQMQSNDLYRAVLGADRARSEMQDRIDHLLKAAADTPSSNEKQAQALRTLNSRMQEFKVKLSGDSTISSRAEKVPLSITGRIKSIVNGHWNSQSAVTGNYRDSYAIADRQFRQALAELKAIAADLTEAEASLQADGAPWTPGRIPEWP
jgi:hypothetical protein